MSVSILITEPEIGQELQNVQNILEHLQKLNPEESFGIVVSNSAIMGMNISVYTNFYDFTVRQNQAIQKLQSGLKNEQWVIGSLLDTDTLRYVPVLIQSSSILIGDVFSVPTPHGSKKIGILTDTEQGLSECTLLEAVLLTQEFSFQTGLEENEQIPSLSSRISLTEKELTKILQELQHKYQTTILNIPVKSLNNGSIWEGLLGWNLDGKCQFYYYSQECLLTLELRSPKILRPLFKRSASAIEHIFHTLCYGIQAYLSHTGLKKVVVALSGGIDSAVVASLATLALGKENVLGLLMPGPYSSQHSVDDAVQLCKNLGINYKIHPIDSIFQEYLRIVEQNIQKSLSLENLQARIRGTLLMAYSNEIDALALNTCNKSEDLVGYATLYGDAVGAFAPIGDLYKLEVYELAEYINIRGYREIIPFSTLTKAPSAELKEDQKDTDTLPTYEKLDPFLYAYVEKKRSPYQVAEELGIPHPEVVHLLKKIFYSEYKRQQSPTVLKIGDQKSILYRNQLSQTQSWQ